MKHDLTKETIRIGTLVAGKKDPVDYIRQILPHGFESLAMPWRQFCSKPR